jgi:hypothetical protein
MAYRVFIDSNGLEWQAWDVLPKAVERRRGNRRVCREPQPFADRRRSERRQIDGRWTPLTSGLRDGWLCFDAGGAGARRRLTPIPPNWESCEQPELENYCRSATPVRLSSPARRG